MMNNRQLADTFTLIAMVAGGMGTILVVLAVARIFPEIGKLKTLDVPAHEPA